MRAPSGRGRAAALAAIGLAAAIAAAPARAAPEATSVLALADAAPTTRFLDSIGINTHWSYRDTVYATAYPQVRDLLVALGIRHVRDGWNARIADLAARGIKTTIIADPRDMPLSALHAHIRALLPTGGIDAIEGPNEPDISWVVHHVTYDGKGYPQGVVAFQRRLYDLFKSDPETASLPIIGFSLGTPFDAGAGHPNPFARGALAPFVDWGNFHPYPFNGNPFSAPIRLGSLKNLYADGDFPSIDLDRFPHAFATYAPPFAPKPMVATETGYPTSPTGTSEALQAKYVPRLFAEYFRLGIKRTYLYTLIDDKSGADGAFGIIRKDLAPKPAYDAVKSLISTLRAQMRPGDAPLPPGQSVTIRARGRGAFWDPSFLHALLLRDGGDSFTLMLWDEASGEDRSVTPHRPIVVPDLPVEIELPRRARAVSLRRYDADWQLAEVPLHSVGPELHLDVPDSLVLLRFTVASTAAEGSSTR